MPLFGTSGIRRLADRELFNLALATGLALGKIRNNVLVGGDTRTSSAALKQVFIAGLSAAGARAFDGDTMPTPTLALAARHFAAGVMVTASHNPPEYNGIKLFNPDGSSFDTAQGKELEDSINSDLLGTAHWTEIKNPSFEANAIAAHIERIAADFPAGLKTRVVVDCAGGAAAVITPHLLRHLGCDVIALNACPTGFFPHEIEPVAANLTDLSRAVVALGAAGGIAHDGDADRAMAVDENGEFIPGDKLLAILGQAIKAKDVVTTIDASMTIEELAASGGFSVSRTRVGDPFVSEELRQHGDFGGEPSGAWVFPKVSLCPDGIYAAAVIAAIAGETRLSELVARIPAYPIRRGSFPHRGFDPAELKRRLLTLSPLSVSEIDGLKLIFPDGWCLVRPSGTEPRVRLTVEAKTAYGLQRIYDRAGAIITGVLHQGSA
jgi:phosphoglucosamine mutase